MQITKREMRCRADLRIGRLVVRAGERERSYAWRFDVGVGLIEQTTIVEVRRSVVQPVSTVGAIEVEPRIRTIARGERSKQALATIVVAPVSEVVQRITSCGAARGGGWNHRRVLRCARTVRKCEIYIGRRLEQRKERRRSLCRQSLIARRQTIEQSHRDVGLRVDSLIEIQPDVLTLESVEERKNSAIRVARE